MTMDKGVVTKKVVNGTAKRTHPFVAQLFPLLAAAVQLALWPKVRPLFWLFFYPAVFFSSWIGRFAGGISATALSIPLQPNLVNIDFSLILPDIMLIADEVDAQLTQCVDSFLKTQAQAMAVPA